MADFYLNNVINAHLGTREKKEFKSWRASRIGQCPRAHYLLRKGAEETNVPDERQQGVFGVGDLFHEFIYNVVEEAANDTVQVETEGELYDKELDLGGRYDLLITSKDSRILYDIKSQHSRSFWHMEAESKETGERYVYPHHKMQIGAYMLMLERQGTPVDEGRMFYISKDDFGRREVSVPFTDELRQSVIDELALLNKHWKAGTLPPCNCPETTWGVHYCPFAVLDSKKSVEIKSRTGRTYRAQQYTKCCPEDALEQPTNKKEENASKEESN